jgi:hypothetical protein
MMPCRGARTSWVVHRTWNLSTTIGVGALRHHKSLREAIEMLDQELNFSCYRVLDLKFKSKTKKGEEEWLRAPYSDRESRRNRKAKATIKYSLMVEVGYGTRQVWNLT